MLTLLIQANELVASDKKMCDGSALLCSYDLLLPLLSDWVVCVRARLCAAGTTLPWGEQVHHGEGSGAVALPLARSFRAADGGGHLCDDGVRSGAAETG